MQLMQLKEKEIKQYYSFLYSSFVGTCWFGN